MTETKKPTPDEALAKLKTGNKVYVEGASGGKVDDADKRVETAKSQHPYAVVVSCSDSRVPAERLFGAGCGDIFVIRNAGNCVDTAALGSIQYAVAVLGSPLVVVMGHTRCGAVAAAAGVVNENKAFPGAIGPMIQPIIPAVLSVKGKSGDLVDNAVSENAKRTADRLRDDPILAKSLAGEALKIVAARYDLDTGKVQFLEDTALVA